MSSFTNSDFGKKKSFMNSGFRKKKFGARGQLYVFLQLFKGCIKYSIFTPPHEVVLKLPTNITC